MWSGSARQVVVDVFLPHLAGVPGAVISGRTLRLRQLHNIDVLALGNLLAASRQLAVDLDYPTKALYRIAALEFFQSLPAAVLLYFDGHQPTAIDPAARICAEAICSGRIDTLLSAQLPIKHRLKALEIADELQSCSLECFGAVADFVAQLPDTLEGWREAIPLTATKKNPPSAFSDSWFKGIAREGDLTDITLLEYVCARPSERSRRAAYGALAELKSRLQVYGALSESPTADVGLALSDQD